MAVLDVPINRPMIELQGMLRRELRFSEVQSFKVHPTFIRIEHFRRIVTD